MPEGDSTKEKIELFIESYKLLVSGFLLLLIVLGGGFLIYQKSIQDLSYNEKLSRLEDRVAELESVEIKNNRNETVEINEQLQPKAPQEDNAGQASGVSSTENSKEVTGKVNINTASASELDTLPGIGPTYAKRIIEYRQQTGGFKSIEEIKNVKGIGDKTYEKFKDKIAVK